MKNILFALLLFSSQVWPITGQQYYQATNSNTGWLNEVVFEAMFDSVTNQPILLFKWKVTTVDGTDSYCKRANLDDISLHTFFVGKGPQSLGYFFMLWQRQPNSADPWCLQ